MDRLVSEGFDRVWIGWLGQFRRCAEMRGAFWLGMAGKVSLVLER